LNALLSYLEVTWTSIIEEYIEVDKIKNDVTVKLSQYLNEDPDDKPTWWNEDCKQSDSGALLCLLMTGVSEPGVIKWFTEKFVTVVCIPSDRSDESKI